MEAIADKKDILGGRKRTVHDPEAGMQLKGIFEGSWMTQAVWVAAELGIADLLAETPRNAEQLAALTQTNSNVLYRILRALAGIGIFAEDREGVFSLTAPAQLLRSDVEGSQRYFSIMMGAEFHGAWGELLYSSRTGKPGFEKRFGAPAFQYMLEHPERHAIYDKAMGSYGKAEVESMLAAYDFSGFRTLVDVGGGSGVLLTAVLDQYTGLEGVLFDLPPVAERARALFRESHLSGRCRIEGGDFFSSVPAGADAYVLHHIIHDWEDREAVSILRACRDAMHAGSRILLAESVIPPGNEPSFGKLLDLMMLLVGGRERTKEEYYRLFSAAGLKLSRIVPTASEVSIIEGRI